MSGPKHLWAGDWESESASTADDLTRVPGPVFEPEPEAEPEPPAAARRRWSRRQLVIALSTGVAAAAVTVGLVTALGGSDQPKHHRVPAASAKRSPGSSGGAAPLTNCQNPGACTRATPVVSGPTADWMGMQIVTSRGGIVISTVRPGSLADQAGFEPGDQIEQLDGHSVNSIDQIREATARIKLGKPVSLQVLRDSTILQAASMAMTERPTVHP